jgi:hypothetical protein
MSAAAATAETEALFMSKFGNLSVGGGAECLHARKQGEEASSSVFCVDDWYFD